MRPGALIVALLALVGLGSLRPDFALGSGAPARDPWRIWLAKDVAAQADDVRLFQEMMRRSDGRRVLARAEQFAQRPPAEQARLRAIQAARVTVLDDQPTAQRRWLRELPAAAQAQELAKLLRQQYPALVAGLPRATGPSRP